MGIVNTLCTRKEKAVRHYYVNLIVKFFEGNSEITQRDGGGGWMPVKDVHICGVTRPKFDVCG